MVLVASHGISRVPRYSGTHRESADCRLRGCHPLWPIVPDRSTNLLIDHSLALKPDGPYNPFVQARRFGLFRVRSPLLAESLLFSLPRGTKMVHFPPLAARSLCIQPRAERVLPSPVARFGDSRIKACLRLPETYRSLPRPSSPLCAKASTVCP